MADAPANTGSIPRRVFFAIAWLLLAIALLIPTSSGLPGDNSLGGSAVYVYGKAIAWSQARPGTDVSLSLAQIAVAACTASGVRRP